MTVLVLLTGLRKHGVAFIAESNRLRVLSPRGVPLSEAVKAEIQRQKDEILARLRSGGIGPESVAEVFPGAAVTEPANGHLPQPEPEAVAWLRSKLADGPQHIAPLIAEWCGGEEVRQRDGTLRWEGGRDGTNERWIDELMQARWMLGVEVYIGEDERCWWQLPQSGAQ